MGLLPKRLRKNPVSVAASTATFNGMLEHINSVNTADVDALSKPNKVSAAMRLSLATFLEEWTESDVGHEKYIENLIEGFDENEAIKMGDLLEWMAIGTDDQFSNEVKLPKGVKHAQLVGLHAQLLDFLPMKSYNTFTMVQLLENDPELVEEVFNNYVELTATEHDALQALTNIVKRGSIESVRLLLEASPLHGEKGYGFTKMENYGSMLVDTFELCRRASVAYKDGNYMGAKAILDQLYDEKGIDAALVRTDLSKMAPMILKVKSGDGFIGPEDLVMVSLVPSSLNRKNLVSAEEGKRKATGEIKKGDKFTGLEVSKTFSENNGVILGNDPTFQFYVNSKVKEINDARNDVTDLSEGEIKDDVKNMIFDIELAGTNQNRGQYTQFKITSVRSKGEESDDDGEGTRRLRRNPPKDGKISNEEIMKIVRQNAFKVESTGQGNKKKTNLLCKADELMKAIYSKQEVGNDLVFIIHAYLKYGGGSTGTPSADFVPKGTVTFATATKMTKDKKKVEAYQMHIEELPGAREATRSVLVRDKVDPLDKLTEEIAPETRRNPMPEPEFVSEHKSRTIAGKAAQARAIKTGETAYMWDEYGVYKVSIDFPGMIDPTTVVAYEAGTGKKLPTIPKKNAPFGVDEVAVASFLVPIAGAIIGRYLRNRDKKEILDAVKNSKPSETVANKVANQLTPQQVEQLSNIDEDLPPQVEEFFEEVVEQAEEPAIETQIIETPFGIFRYDIDEQSMSYEGGQTNKISEYMEQFSDESELLRTHDEVIEGNTAYYNLKKKSNPQMPLVMGMPNARKLAQEYANELGVSAYIIRDDSSSRKGKNYYTVTTDEQLGTHTFAQTWVISPNSDASHTYGIKNPKGGGKKGVTAVGNTYAIDLLPKSSVKLRGMKDIKKDNKILHTWRDSSEAMKNLWKKYSATGKGGSAESFVAAKGFTTKIYKMRKGQRWNPLKPPYTEEGRMITKERAIQANKSMKDLAGADFRSFKRKGVLILKPDAQRVGKVGASFVKYKKGKVRLELMLARHKDSGSLVPFRIFVPAALYRHDNDTLIPRSGSGDTKGARELLSLIESTFGKVSFVKNVGGGGLNVAPKDKRSGKPKPEGAIDEGVGKIFKTAGMKVQDGKIARPYLFDNGRITYQAGGRQYVMEVSR